MDEAHLEEMYRMVEENNSILRGMRHSALMSGFFRFLFWVAIIAAIYFGWQDYIHPVVNQASQTYQSAASQMQATQQSLQQVQNAASSTQSFFGGILKNFGF